MAKWKLCRQTYGDDIYEFAEGDQVTIGRGTQNTIVLPSLNISRKHCVITVKRDEVIIEDLKSANGIFVGLKKILPNTPFSLSNNDIIGLGWTDGAALAKVNDAEKFVFKLLKTANDSSIVDRIQFQNEPRIEPVLNNSTKIIKSTLNLSLKRKNGTETIKLPEHQKNSNKDLNIRESQKSTENGKNLCSKRVKCNFNNENEKEKPITKLINEDVGHDVLHIKHEPIENDIVMKASECEPEQTSKLSLKRKSSPKPQEPKENINSNINKLFGKKFKGNNINYENEKAELIIKIENEDERYKAFDIKQECFDDEIQIIDSDSESEQWYIRLSQNSNRESFSTFNETRKSEECHQDSSYSQLDDDDVIFVENETKNKNELDEDEYKDDLFTILPVPINVLDSIANKSVTAEYDINEKIERNVTTAFPNTCNNTSEKKDGNKNLLSVDNPDNTSNYRIKKNEDEINNLSSNSCDTTKKHTESKPIAVYQVETKQSHTFVSETTNKSYNNSRKIQLTDRISQPSKKLSHNSKGKVKKKSDQIISKPSKIQITSSQKEERKKKLREIATKAKGEAVNSGNSTSPQNEESGITILKACAKVTTSNRGAFLTDLKQSVSKPTNKRIVTQGTKDFTKDTNTLIHISDGKDHDIIHTNSNSLINEFKHENDKKNEHQLKGKSIVGKLNSVHSKHRTLSTDSTFPKSIEVQNTGVYRRNSVNITQDSDKQQNRIPSALKNEDFAKNSTSKNETEKSNSHVSQSQRKEKIRIGATRACDDDNTVKSDENKTSYDNSAPTKSALKSSIKAILKPMKENTEPNSKSDKRVRFSEVKPQIIEFEIELGNQMKKTNSVKSTLLATHHDIPVFSLQKIALQKILRWNPQWLEEQNNFSEPPPILGHNNIPMAILHSFSCHAQYVEVIGDLLLMEIWECLTQGYVKTRSENNYLQMRVEWLPVVPPQRRGLGLINLNVNVSALTARAHIIPREGEIMMCHFGEDMKICRFFYVHNVRVLSSPPNNVNSFYSISLQTSITEKMRTLQCGAVIYGKRLAYISKDLRLFEAMEYLCNSPLHEVILNPQSRHFVLDESDRACNLVSQWTQPLNDSQKKAVMCAVSAAYGDRPRIHMIQGPPGTGKSRVICAIVMEYFYDAAGKKQKNRGKLLISATSNAAVDELVVRLLDIRQSLPQPDRLKLVRVGRMEAMHPRARDISSLNLAERDVARLQSDHVMQPTALSAEISLLEAKQNMWQTKAVSATDDARKAYCQDRVAGIAKKIAMFRSGNGGAASCGPERVAQAERRVLEGADVVLTTLASAHSHKMRGLAGRIALCVVDEAGQAIEPETLVPLTLGITRLALVGDPQQLPGYICSQRAKQHGLGESLFSRLSSCAETWSEGGPILLDRQYRMHPHIADYPNRAFYDGRLYNEFAQAPAPALNTAPYFVLGIFSNDNGQDTSGFNEAEAWGAARVALALRSRLRAVATTDTSSLAVITPYTAQRDLMRRHLRTLLQVRGANAETEVEVNTVDSFQGQERSVVVVSLARSHGVGFLTDAGRMNVMLTRAKYALVLCLNPRALEKNNQWRSLVEDAQRRNLYGTLPIHMCTHPSVQQITDKEILQYLSSNPPQCVNITNPSLRTHKRKRGNKRRNNVKHI